MIGEKLEDEKKIALRQTLNYLHDFRANCAQGYDKAKIEDFTCAYEQMRAIDIDDAQVKRCYDESFVEGTDRKNLLLQQDVNDELDLGIALHPSLTINDMSYRGYLDSDDIFDAICSSFTKMPQVCKDPLDK